MPEVQKELERFRRIITEDWKRTESEGHPIHPISRLSSISIACRHFAMPHHARPTLPADEILRIAAEVTGLPMEEMEDADGKRVMMWWPVRGEVGWLPYRERPMMWLNRDWEWDTFANRWTRKGTKGQAISRVPVGA